MGWSGGTFSRVHNWVADKNAGTDPQASRFDAEDDNFATGINSTLHKGGQNSPTADMPWGSNKITGLADGTAATDAAAYGQVAMEPVEYQDLTSGSPNTVAFSHTIEAGYIYELILKNVSPNENNRYLGIQWAVSGTYNTGATDYSEISNWLTATAATQQSSGFNVVWYSGYAGVQSTDVVGATIRFYGLGDAIITSVIGDVYSGNTAAAASVGRGWFSARSAAAEAHDKIRLYWSATAVFDSGDAYLYRIKEVT